jgi:hypothetical protein
VSRPSRTLVRRIDALEANAKSAPQHRNPLLDLAVTAIASAWTPEEVEQMLAASERSQLKEIPADLRRRWVARLDCLSVEHFARPFRELLAFGHVAPGTTEPRNQSELNLKEMNINGHQKK